jgi:type II secretory pathway pseudopilin PulG
MKFKKGFTIIETLVAITILMISIVGPLTIAQKSLNASIYAKDQVIASFLAQEQIELVKFERNGVVNSGADFKSWIKDYPSNCAAYPLLYIGATDGYTTNNSGTPTKFSRCTDASLNTGGNEALITVKVKWNNGTIENETVLENRIFPIAI